MTPNDRKLCRMIHSLVFQKPYEDFVPDYTNDWFHTSKIYKRLFEIGCTSIDLFREDDGMWGCFATYSEFDGAHQVSIRCSSDTAQRALCWTAADLCRKLKR